MLKSELDYLISLSRIGLTSNDPILVNVSEASEQSVKQTFEVLSCIAKEREGKISCPITV